MPEPIEIEFEYRAAEFASGMRLYLAERLKTRRSVALASGLIALSIVLLAFDKNAFLSVIVLVVAASMLVLQGMALLVWPRRIFRTEPSFQDRFRLRFTGAGIRLLSSAGDVDTEWAAYDHLLENDRVIVLVAREAVFTAIPKSAFEDEEQEREFRDLVRASIGG